MSPASGGLILQLCNICQVSARLSCNHRTVQVILSVRWLVVVRYLKNLIEKSPASVCFIFKNYSFCDIYWVLIGLDRIRMIFMYRSIPKDKAVSSAFFWYRNNYAKF